MGSGDYGICYKYSETRFEYGRNKMLTGFVLGGPLFDTVVCTYSTVCAVCGV